MGAEFEYPESIQAAEEARRELLAELDRDDREGRSTMAGILAGMFASLVLAAAMLGVFLLLASLTDPAPGREPAEVPVNP